MIKYKIFLLWAKTCCVCCLMKIKGGAVFSAVRNNASFTDSTRFLILPTPSMGDTVFLKKPFQLNSFTWILFGFAEPISLTSCTLFATDSIYNTYIKCLTFNSKAIDMLLQLLLNYKKTGDHILNIWNINHENVKFLVYELFFLVYNCKKKI